MKALIASLLLTAPVLAQDRQMTADDFLNLVETYTVTFVSEDTGATVGVERFLSRDRTVWARADGSCTYGTVTARANKVCFLYEDTPSINWCWIPFEEAGEVYVQSTRSAHIQRLAHIGTQPIGCDGEPLS